MVKQNKVQIRIQGTGMQWKLYLIQNVGQNRPRQYSLVTIVKYWAMIIVAYLMLKYCSRLLLQYVAVVYLFIYLGIPYSALCSLAQGSQPTASGKHFRISRKHSVANVRHVGASAVPRETLDCHPTHRRHLLRSGLKAQRAARYRPSGLRSADVSHCEVERRCSKGRNRTAACFDCGSCTDQFLETWFWQQSDWAVGEQLALSTALNE